MRRGCKSLFRLCRPLFNRLIHHKEPAMNLAAKHNIEVSLRPTDTVVLTIVNIEERQVRNADGSTMGADVLIGRADNGTRYTVRLNNVTAGQLVRLFGP